MLISSILLKNSIENYNRIKKKNQIPEGHIIQENYTFGEAARAGTNAALVSFFLVVSYVFFILELVLLYYAINMALVCTEGGPERIVNMVLAVIFTLPYVLLNILFNDCAKQSLKVKRK